MPRGSLFLLFSAATLAQVPPRDPFDRAMQAIQEARRQGNPAEAAARRDEARHILGQMPAGSPQWAGRVQSLAQLYQSSGRHTEARAVIQDALSRADVLAAWDPARIQLLSTLTDFWQQDGNLLKALACREKAVNALAETPPAVSAGATQATLGDSVASISGVGNGIFLINGRQILRPGRGGNNGYQYEQLVALYRQLGRPEAASKAVAKMRSLIQNDLGALANSYEGEGDLDQARNLLEKQAANTAARPQSQPWEVLGPLERIASMYERENRLADAVATLQRAATYLDASSQPQARNQAVGVRLRLAGLFQQSGQQQAADQMYKSLLSETANDQIDQRIPVLQQYANQLSQTGRGSQGAQMLKEYLADHGDLQPWQEANLLFTLSQLARQAGQNDLAEQYQRAAQEKQRTSHQRQPETQQLVGPKLQQAQAAANQGNIDEAVTLALDAITSAPVASDGDQVAWQVPSLAGALANKKAPEKGEMVYRALFPMLEAGSVDNVGPLQQALRQYALFLMSQKDRLGDAALAIDRYRESLAATQGAETHAMVQVQQLHIELARAKGAPEEAARAAEEMLALEESLSGATSAPYLDTAQTTAEVYRTSGQIDRALPLYRQIAAIADLAIPANDARRGFVRMNAAMVFAEARRFEEAERLAQEAVAAGEAMHPSRADMFRSQAEQIQRMKAAGAAAVAPGRGTSGNPAGRGAASVVLVAIPPVSASPRP